MIFHWQNEDIEVEFGTRIRGMQRNGHRPNQCSLNPKEVWRYLHANGEYKLAAYLHTIEMALKK